MILKFNQLNENKMWYKTIEEMLNYISSKDIPWVILDTETTGLKGSKEEQLTQVSAIVSRYDIISNEFEELSQFDEKIKLTQKIKDRYAKPDDTTRRILGFNHYGSGNYKYKEERDIVDGFFNWVKEYSPCLLIAQNAIFDMNMLGGRFGHKINNEVFDTKMLIQLYFLPLILTLAETDDSFKSMVDSIGTSVRDNGLISSSLSKVGPALGLNMTGYHDAISDVRITMKMIQKIVELLKEYKDVDIKKYQVERIKSIRLK
jgi:DNA polymerase III epsilon subunit-like protein